jgi:F-type H+-transporting ATPase subunit b
MLIDWFTVGAQAINFVVLVWLLKRFLYKPVLSAIDGREKRIAAELADADLKRAEAQKERDEFQEKNKAFDAERADLMGKAAGSVKAERERLFSEVRAEADSSRAKQESELNGERTKLSAEITRLATAEVFDIARKALADLATVSLEERMGEVFTRRLREMDATDKLTLTGAFRTSSEPARIRSTFDLGPVQRAAIQNALNETFSTDIRVRFETAASGICGVELSVNGQKISWSIANYLGSLERKVGALIEARSSFAIAKAPPAQESLPVLSVAG